MALTASAATETWSGTKSYTANTTVSAAITVSGAVTVDVSSGKTVTLKGAITGTDKITKTGLGTLLILSANDNFSGGFVIEKGYLTASNATALGSAAVTIVGQTAENSGNCCLGLWGTGKGNTTGITYANAVNITGNTTYAYPALVVYGQGAKLTGKITAAKDFVFYDDYNSTAAIWSGKSDRATDGNVISLTFGEVEVGGMLFHDGWCRFIFDGKVTAPAVSFAWLRSTAYSGNTGNHWAVYEFNTASEIGTLTNAYHSLILNAANVFNGTKYVINGSVTQRALLTLNGNAQRFNCFDTAPYTASENSVRGPTSSSLTTVTIDGGGEMPAGMQENRVACFERFMSKINLTVDAYDGFTQVISNRSHTMSGTLTVNNGALEIGGDAGFTALPTIVVGAAGKLTVDTTYGKAFKALTSITVNGTLELTANVDTPIPDTAALTIGESGWVDLSGGVLAVKSLTVNGVAKSGTLTHSDLPDNLAEGSTIIVKGTDTIEYTDVDKTANGDWHVYVFAGCTNMVRVALTGNGRLIKEGPGILMLTKESSYKGGTTISAGYVRVETNNVFGTGEITILGQHGNYSGPCEIDMIGCPKKNSVITYHTTITNDIHITGNTAIAYPAIVGFNNGSIVSGKITADRDFFFKEDELSMYAITKSYSSSSSSITSLTFGEVNATGSITHDGWATFVFNGKVVAGAFFAGGYLGGSNWNAAFQFNDDVVLNAVTNRCHTMTFAKSLTIANKYYAAKRSQIKGGHLNVNGAQSIGGISDDVNYSTSTWLYTAQKASTLTITGLGSAATECNTTYKFDGPLSIDLNATDNFTQCFSNRVNAMTGAITVTKGTFKIAGAATFANISALTVKSGAKFINLSTAANSLSVIKTLNIEEGATVTLPAGLTLNLDTFTYHGQQMPAGRYEDATAFGFPAGTAISVAQCNLAATTVAVWTGAGENGNMSNMDNWLVNGVKPESIDFTSGTTTVRIDSGTEMIPDTEGIRLHSITNNRVATSTLDIFYIGAVGKTLYVDGQIVSTNKAALGYRGTLTASCGADQTEISATANGKYGISHFNNIKTTGHQGIYFAGATIKKPFYNRPNLTGCIPYTGVQGTTNLIAGKFVCNCYANNEPIVEEDSVVEFAGGYSQTNRPWKRGNGTLKFSGKPAYSNTGISIEQGAMVLAVTNNTFNAAGGDNYNNGIRIAPVSGCTASLTFECSYCAKDDDLQQLELKGLNRMLTVDFGGTTQRFSRVWGTNTNSKSAMTGVYPAMLEVKGGTKWTAAKYFIGLTNNVNITGGLGFHYLGNGPAQSTYGAPAGSADVYVLERRAFSTCGNLEVSGGTLELASNATWLNGTNFVANGTGTLRFTAAGQVNSDIAALRLDDTGKVEISEGVTLRVNSAWLDGQAVEDGTYQKGDTGIAAHIEGAGTLKVGKKGTTILLW